MDERQKESRRFERRLVMARAGIAGAALATLVGTVLAIVLLVQSDSCKSIEVTDHYLQRIAREWVHIHYGVDNVPVQCETTARRGWFTCTARVRDLVVAVECNSAYACRIGPRR